MERWVRWIALLLFGGALLVTATDWAVRRRIFAVFGWWPRTVRKLAGPVLKPIEVRLHRAGANPMDAPLWLLGIAAVVGIALVSLARWVNGSIGMLGGMAGAPPSAWIRLVAGAAFTIVMAALFVRVIGSWLGLGRYTRWMRPVFLLTDWLVEPIRRRLPPFGALDLSPLIAYVVLLLLRALLLR